MIASLREALAARNAEAYRRHAHSLKSNCNTFGALGLAAQSREIELGGLHSDAAQDEKAVDALAHTYTEVAAALKGLRRG